MLPHPYSGGTVTKGVVEFILKKSVVVRSVFTKNRRVEVVKHLSYLRIPLRSPDARCLLSGLTQMVLIPVGPSIAFSVFPHAVLPEPCRAAAEYPSLWMMFRRS